MKKEYENQVFVEKDDRYFNHIYQNMKFLRCEFNHCLLSVNKNPRNRTIVRQVELKQTKAFHCTIHTAVIEDVLVDGLQTDGLLISWGAVYKHVKIKGNIDRIMLSPILEAATASDRRQKVFDQANEEYYKNVDWSLDISEARFWECDLRLIPARSVIRDPNTQVIVTYEKATKMDWKKLDLSKTYWPTAIDHMIEFKFPDMVLVAPKRHPKFQDYLDGLKKLQDFGVAEVD